MASTRSLQCSTCRKTYNTQASLTRHAHNHREAPRHVCNICDVSFSRRDLLRRHRRIHERAAEDQEAEAPRIRAHTACLGCRQARVKCVNDPGSHACNACQKASRPCSLSSDPRRVSTVLHDRRRQARDREESLDLDDVDARTHELEEQTSIHDFGIATPTMDHYDGLPDFTENVGISQDQTLAWAWLHEDQFLQGNILDSWLDEPFHENSVIHSMSDSSTVNPEDLVSEPMEILKNPSAEDPIPQTSTNPANLERPLQSSCRKRRKDKGTHSNQGLQAPTVSAERQIARQTSMVTELVEYAKEAASNAYPRRQVAAYWNGAGPRVDRAFDLERSPGFDLFSNHPLAHFIDLYFTNFWGLWPLFPLHNFDAKHAHPVLFLTITSVGSMYAGHKASQYGALMHEYLREYLAEPLFDGQGQDDDSLAIAQARSLTQVSALYFGQKKGFSYSQHLGSILISQARRMNLFSPPSYQLLLQTLPDTKDSSVVNSEWLYRWIASETRKRLAYAILRLEAYTSVLLNCRPLLTAEELELELPCSKFLWLSSFSSDSAYMAAIRQDLASSIQERMLFSDAVNIATDEKEWLQPTDIISHELVAFGLQQHVWRSCRDVESALRISGRDAPELLFNGLDAFEVSNDREANLAIQSSHTPLQSDAALSSSLPLFQTRQMEGLRLQCQRTCKALRKWRRSLVTIYIRPSSPSDRTSLISSLMLYHLSFLQMLAPLQNLHHISYHSIDNKAANSNVLRQVMQWTQSHNSIAAAQHACIIWKLLNGESRRPTDDQARYNFLSLIGLHHAAVVVWTYAGTRDTVDNSLDTLSLGLTDGTSSSMPFAKQNSRCLLDMFVGLFRQISPAWSARSSFAAAASRLARTDFPSKTMA